jgi:excisionase family DNA binding protein
MKSETSLEPDSSVQDHVSTFEAARMLGMAVRSVQLMVDRNELRAWKTPGGHRRISRESVEQWVRGRAGGGAMPGSSGWAALSGPAPLSAVPPAPPLPQPAAPIARDGAPHVLLIEDSIHFQNLVSLLVEQNFPGLHLHVANDGITGLAMYGQIQPDILIVDILLPGIDGGALITTLRSHPQFARSHLIVVTSLDEAQRAPYAFALQGVNVIHKPRLVAELPALLAAGLARKALP